MTAPSPIDVLAQRETHREWYHLNKDSIYEDRLSWQAHGFRHMVHLLPGRSILEIGAGNGLFTKHLVNVTKGRNKITAVRFNAKGVAPVSGAETVERLNLSNFPGPLKGRKFRYVVVQNLIDRDNASFLLSRIYDLLEDGGQAIFLNPTRGTPSSPPARWCRN